MSGPEDSVRPGDPPTFSSLACLSSRTSDLKDSQRQSASGCPWRTRSRPFCREGRMDRSPLPPRGRHVDAGGCPRRGRRVLSHGGPLSESRHHSAGRPRWIVVGDLSRSAFHSRPREPTVGGRRRPARRERGVHVDRAALWPWRGSDYGKPAPRPRSLDAGDRALLSPGRKRPGALRRAGRERRRSPCSRPRTASADPRLRHYGASANHVRDSAGRSAGVSESSMGKVSTQKVLIL